MQSLVQFVLKGANERDIRRRKISLTCPFLWSWNVSERVFQLLLSGMADSDLRNDTLGRLEFCCLQMTGVFQSSELHQWLSSSMWP